MNSKVFHLLYRSSASVYITAEVIGEILERSRVNNAMKNISGLLIYRAGHFIQLLEGKKSEVEATYQRIQKDKRHENAKVLIEFESERPIFPEWSMGFIEDEKVTSELTSAIDTLAASAKSGPASQEAIITALRQFNSSSLGKSE